MPLKFECKTTRAFYFTICGKKMVEKCWNFIEKPSKNETPHEELHVSLNGRPRQFWRSFPLAGRPGVGLGSPLDPSAVRPEALLPHWPVDQWPANGLPGYGRGMGAPWGHMSLSWWFLFIHLAFVFCRQSRFSCFLQNFFPRQFIWT